MSGISEHREAEHQALLEKRALDKICGPITKSQWERKPSAVLSSVISDLQAREKKGLEIYGTTMDRGDLSRKEWLQHLYEELLDGAMYIKKLILMEDELK